MELANLFSTILDIEPRLFQPIEQKSGMGLHGLFRPIDSRHSSVISSPTHPLGFCHVIADAACPSELASQLESASQGPVIGGFALAGVCEPVSLARGEHEGTIRQVKFGGPSSRPWAYESPSSATEGLRRCYELDPVIGLAALPVPSGSRVLQPHAARILAETGLVANRADPLAGRGVRPHKGATPGASRPKEPIAKEF